MLVSFYVGVSQRASNKLELPNIVKYIKAYINFDVNCAWWLLHQFCNVPLLMECFLESPPQTRIMR